MLKLVRPSNAFMVIISHLIVIFGVLLSAMPRLTQAAEVTVAVASNFAAPMNLLAIEFNKDSGHVAKLSFGSSGKLYSQIRNGAPFEVFLSADTETPAKLEQEGLTVAGTRVTYAVGSLALWSWKTGFVDGQGDVLRNANFNKLAIANPKLAPYGRAAIEVLAGMGLLDTLRQRFVTGENIGQTHQFVASGNADLGFVAVSQVMQGGQLKGGSVWIVPAELHSPIRQDAVILTAGKSNPAASALMLYLKGTKAQTLFGTYGYRN